MLKNFIFSKKGKQSVECVLYCEQHLCLLTFPFNVFFFTGTSQCFVIRPSSLAVVVLIAEPHAEPCTAPEPLWGQRRPVPWLSTVFSLAGGPFPLANAGGVFSRSL